jgi:hypothetical protein
MTLVGGTSKAVFELTGKNGDNVERGRTMGLGMQVLEAVNDLWCPDCSR